MIEPDIHGIARRLGRAAQRRRAMIITAESCTGGGVAQAITDIAGSSGWFDRGFVTYGNAAKRDLLGVKARTLAAHGAVSEAVAREMAVGAIRHGGRGLVGVAVTGIAGPGGGSKAKPVGTVWFAWAARGGLVQSRGFVFRGDRGQVRRQAVAVALQGLIDLLG